jgi:hypothetical protein
MGRIARIFGFDPKKLWYYRDLALAIIAAFATLWAVFALGFESTPFDGKLGVACVGIVIVCCILTPNWHIIIGSVLGFAAIQGWLAAAFSGDARSYWVAIPATVLGTVFFLTMGRRPVQTK